MLKYELWTSSNHELLLKLSGAVEKTGRADRPSSTFGPSVFIVAYWTSPTGLKTFAGMAQLTTTWSPIEWQNSPFSFAHRGALHAQWIFCRQFTYPPSRCVANSLRDLRRLSSGDELGKSAGDELFRIFREAPAEENRLFNSRFL